LVTGEAIAAIEVVAPVTVAVPLLAHAPTPVIVPEMVPVVPERIAGCVADPPRPKFVRAVPTAETSERLFAGFSGVNPKAARIEALVTPGLEG
jgi:hypothetical protein